jgi:hypothetical protein
MASEHVDVATMQWTSAVPFYGPAAIHEGKAVVQLKVLSDRRRKGGGIAWLVKFSPPPGKLIKIRRNCTLRRARLQPGRWSKHQSGKPAQSSGGYSLNPKGQPHSAMIAEESVSLIVYAGEPDEINSLEIVPVRPARG